MPDRSNDWQVWEQTVADALGGERVMGSGSTDKFKGDVKTPEFIVECKWTGGSAYVLTRKLWDKLSMWARNEGRTPLLAVQSSYGRAVVVPEWWWCEKFPHTDFGEQVMSKTVNVAPAVVHDSPVCRRIGHERVVVASFEDFCKLCS